MKSAPWPPRRFLMHGEESCPARTGAYYLYVRMQAGHDDEARRKKRPAAKGRYPVTNSLIWRCMNFSPIFSFIAGHAITFTPGESGISVVLFCTFPYQMRFF
jgi:hypothetical protein